MIFLQAVAVALSLSVDTLAAGLAYGGEKIKIPLKSVLIINLVCSAVTGISLAVGSILEQYLSGRGAALISFFILLLLGVFKLLDFMIKSLIRKTGEIKRSIEFRLFSLRFVLCLYADPCEADVDSSKTLSSVEAVSLGAALSIDGAAVGIGAALAGISPVLVFLCAFVSGVAALCAGVFVGEKLTTKMKTDLSWVSGLILIIMAVTKIL